MPDIPDWVYDELASREDEQSDPEYSIYGGIYRIICRRNGRFYIGRARDLDLRESRHFEDLAKGKHFNFDLQSDYDEYGEDAFSFQVIAVLHYHYERLDAEQELLNEYIDDPKYYNVSPRSYWTPPESKGANE